MKKISCLLLGVLGMMATSCEESLEPSYPQTNPQNPVLQDGDIVLETYGVLASEDVLSLDTYDDPDNSKIFVVKLEKADGLVADAQIKLSLEISKTEDFQKTQSLDLIPSDDDPSLFYADAYDWNALQLNVFGNSIKPQEAYYRVPILISIQGTDYRYMSPDYYGLNGSKLVTRMDPGYQLEENFYVFGPFVGGNTPATGVAMFHDNQDVYDNPVFSYSFEVSEDEVAIGYNLLIAPQSVHDADGTASQCFGVGSETGVLVVGGQPIKVEAAGPYMLEFNALTYEYSLKIAPNSLYAISLNGVSFGNCAQLGTSDFVTYDGMAGLLGAWGLTGQAAYRPTYYANNPKVEASADEKGIVSGGLLLDATGQPLNKENAIPFYSGTSAGLYYLTANLQSMTYTSYACKTMGFCGTFNDWGNNLDDAGEKEKDKMTLTSKRSDNFMVWTGNITVEAGDKWKIRANSDWVVDFGGANGGSYTTDGTPVELSKGGADLEAAEAGTFTVTLYLRRTYENGQMTPYTMTVVPAN